MTDDLLTTIRAELGARLDELRPLLEEYRELHAALDALGDERAAAPGGSISLLSTESHTSPEQYQDQARDRDRTWDRDQDQQAAPGRALARGSALARSSKAGRAVRPKVTRTPGPRRRGRRPSIDSGGEAILAALEHGSHSVAELGVVTALPASEIRESLRRLRVNEAIVKTDRDDGRTAYALPAQAA